MELQRISHVLEDLQITLHDFHEIVDDTVSFSLKYGITIYDASYVALAKALNDLLYTADEKLLYKVKDLSYVKHIKDISY